MSEIWNVAQVAAVLQCSADTVVRRFARLKGVINLGSEGSLGKRRRRMLRIPQAVVEKYVGHPVSLPPPAPKVAGKEWEEKAARDLAKTMKAHAENPQDKELFKAIQEHARVLTFVEEDEWDAVDFLFPGERGK